ncbi:type IV toxin-antitoxin system AbiEi family antitoxin [Dietzia psychralcaliphila]|uniref:type IV toxin-antitoxin system AbiEi family antitoxin n=1 Tax=Dietzia psychralcaliphila TaxID=139021 RepID=UPI001F3EEF04|nr:hypothetical protein [Dietzia psychralcaliphila]
MINGKTIDSRPPSEAELVDVASQALRERLPPEWKIDTRQGATSSTSGGADSLIVAEAPDGSAATFCVTVKSAVVARDIPALRKRCGDTMAQVPDSGCLVLTRYLAPADRARLDAAGISYIDATGNMRVSSPVPALFVSDRGAERDPWRGPGRPRGTLKGEPAAKVVRALLDLPGPWRVRELADVAKASVGSVYRVMQFLEDQGLAQRLPDRRFLVSDWAALLRRWSDDYQLLRSNAVSHWIAPRGLSDLLDTVREEEDVDYALTGSVAAAAWAAYAPARSAMVYVRNVERAAANWGLRATEAGANVLLIEPTYPVVMERAMTALEGLTVARPAQVAVDLMTGPGRAPAEANELIEWMRAHEQSWRG